MGEGMDDKIVMGSGVKKTLRMKFKIMYENGATETVFPVKAPNVNPATPMLMEFVIKEGTIRMVNLTKIRAIDLVVSEEVESKLIV